MAQTVVGLFDKGSDAQAVVNDLEAAGFDRRNINIIANQTGSGLARNADSAAADTNFGTGGRVSHGVGGAVGGAVEGGVIGGLTGLAAGLVLLAIPGIGPVLAAGPIAAMLGGAGLGAIGGGVIGGLTGLGIPREEAEHYVEGVRRGGTLVTAQVPNERAQEAVTIFDRHNPVDIQERGANYARTGYTGYSENLTPYTPEQITTERNTYSTVATAAAAPTPATINASASTMNRTQQTGDTITVPIVEEELAVGKRAIQRGGARIHTSVEERPVEENITLREEHVNVERRPVDRLVNESDLNNAFQERTFEVTERAEEAVIAKQAHVVEEIVVNKEATERQQTVRDTVRRTNVDVEELDRDDTSVLSSNAGYADYNTYANDFRTNFNSIYGSQPGITYTEYEPAYRFGYDLAGDPRYSSYTDWSSFESRAQQDWNSRNLGPWERFKDAIRYGWDRTKNAARNTAARL